MTSRQLRMIGLTFYILGFTMLPINYIARVTTQNNTNEVFNRLNALTTRITKVKKYSLDRNDVERVANEIEETSKILVEIRQSNKRTAPFKNLSFIFYFGLTIIGSVFLILASGRNENNFPQGCK